MRHIFHASWPYARIIFCLSLVLVLALAFSGCSQDAPQQAQGGAGQGGPGGKMGQGQRPQEAAIPVAVAAVSVGPIASYYNATASLEAEKEARILARVTGVVGSLDVEEGDQVNKGDALLRVSNNEYKFRLQQAEAATQNLLSRYQRFEAMLAEELTTEEEYQAARSDLATAEAEEGLARLNLSYTTVRAPFTGKITARLVDVGQNLSIGTELMVMADFHPLLARVHVPSREFNKLQKDQEVDLVLDSSGENLKGRIKLISPVIDPASGTIKITVEVPDYPAGTRPGDFAEVRIVTELRSESLLVPSGAVITDKGETVVYVVGLAETQADTQTEGKGEKGNPGGSAPTAERRIVQTGFTDNLHTEIIGGLKAGEKVVIRGQRSLKNGATVKILDSAS